MKSLITFYNFKMKQLTLKMAVWNWLTSLDVAITEAWNEYFYNEIPAHKKAEIKATELKELATISHAINIIDVSIDECENLSQCYSTGVMIDLVLRRYGLNSEIRTRCSELKLKCTNQETFLISNK